MAYSEPLPKRRGVFHKNTRIAFGSNGHRMHLQEQMLRHKAQYGCAVSCFGSRDMLNHAKRTQEFLPHANGVSGQRIFSPTRKRPLKKLYKGITKNTINNNTRMCMRVLS